MINGYSICLNRWALDKDIKNELGLLLIISSLCAEKGFCWATNKYFAELFEITEVSVSSKIKKLEEKNYIEIKYEKRGCEVIKRELRLKNILTDDSKIFYSTIKKNFKENNINNNIINMNNTIEYTITDNLYEYIYKNFGIQLYGLNYEKVSRWSKIFDETMLKRAVDICVEKSKRNLSYFYGILENWKSNNFETMNDVIENENSRKKARDLQNKKDDIPKCLLNDVKREEISEEEKEELETILKKYT